MSNNIGNHVSEASHFNKTSSKASTYSEGRKRFGILGGRGLKGLMIELMVVAVFLLSALLIAAVVVVVSISSKQMYSSLADATEEAVTRAAADSTASIRLSLESFAPIIYELADVMTTALATPRTPSAYEAASYGMIYSKKNHMYEYTSLYDFGGPSSLLFGAGRFNRTVLQQFIQFFFFRLGGMGPYYKSMLTAWSQFVFQTYMGTEDFFCQNYPFSIQYNLSINFTTQPLVLSMKPTENPSREYGWSDPYKDKITGHWIVALGAPLYYNPWTNDFDDFLGLCALDVYISTFLSYAQQASSRLPWGAYVVIVALDGTLLAIPEQGWEDWTGDPNFNYTAECDKLDYDSTKWNIFTTPTFSEIGSAISARLAATNNSIYPTKILAGKERIHFEATGARLISWDYISSSRWIVVAVIDEHHALSEQERARSLVLIVTVIAGGMVIFFALAVAIYGAVKLQYVRLSNKITDLNTQLELVMSTVNKQDQSPDETAVSALAGGIQKITETLDAIASSNQPVTEQQATVLRDAIKLLLHRDFANVQPLTELNENQQQFILDCGMGVRKSDSVCTLHEELPVGTFAASEESMSSSIEEVPHLEVNKWDFDAYSVEAQCGGHGLLTTVAMSILEETKLTETVALDVPRLCNFLNTMNSSYCMNEMGNEEDNPYHNKYHATDVTQAMHFMLNVVLESSPKMREAVRPLDRLACVLACTMHDYKHPGRNNVFMRNTMHHTHVTFADSSLERFHAANGCQLLFLQDNCKAVRSMTRAEQIELHNTISKLVLATDMAKHVEFLDSFKAWASVQRHATHTSDFVVLDGEESAREIDPVVELDDKGKLLVLQMLLKAADLCNAFREWDVCQPWTMRIVKEFSQQGNEEKVLGLSVSKFMDGSVPPQEMQSTFVPLIVVPMLRALISVFPKLAGLEQIAWNNLQQWRSMNWEVS